MLKVETSFSTFQDFPRVKKYPDLYANTVSDFGGLEIVIESYSNEGKIAIIIFAMKNFLFSLKHKVRVLQTKA